MPDSARRLSHRRVDAWRRGIALFSKGTRHEGPFHQAGYRNFVLEPRLADKTTPDIIAGKAPFFVIGEISVSLGKNPEMLRRYANAQLTPFLRGRLGASVTDRLGAAPFFLTPDEGWTDFPHGINAISLSTPNDRLLPDVTDDELKRTLEDWQGFNDIALPNYSILAVPESPAEEIKPQVVGALKSAAGAGTTIAAAEVAAHLLGDVGDSYTPAARNRFIGVVGDLMQQVSVDLADYCRWIPSTKSLSFEKLQTPAARKAATGKFYAWLGQAFKVRPLEAYDIGEEAVDESENDDEPDDENDETEEAP